MKKTSAVRPRPPVGPITVRLPLSRRAAESLTLEIRRLARQLGVPVADVRLRRVEGKAR